MSPRDEGASKSSPGPVKVEWVISPPMTSFFIENLMAPLSVMVGVMAIIAPLVSPVSLFPFLSFLLLSLHLIATFATGLGTKRAQTRFDGQWTTHR